MLLFYLFLPNKNYTMENYNTSHTKIGNTDSQDNTKSLMASVFSWMTLALVLTTVCSMLFAYIPELRQTLLTIENGQITDVSMFAYVAMFAPLGLVLLIGFRYQKMSFPLLTGCFLAYSILNGISLSFIFFVYSIGSITTCFLSATALFGLFAAAGYFTQTDLTKLGSILMIGVFGLIIASLINYFAKSEAMDYMISFIGVAIFTGLTAYDVQKIKNYGSRISEGESMAKISIMGALNLYMDFLNIFLFLLRLFGNRN